MITLPVDFVADITANIGALFTDIAPLVILAIGLPLAFWAIKRVIGLVRVK